MSTSGMTREMQIKAAGTMSHPADGQTSKGLPIPSVLTNQGKQKFTFIDGGQIVYHYFVEQVPVTLERHVFYDLVISFLSFYSKTLQKMFKEHCLEQQKSGNDPTFY